MGCRERVGQFGYICIGLQLGVLPVAIHASKRFFGFKLFLENVGHPTGHAKFTGH